MKGLSCIRRLVTAILVISSVQASATIIANGLFMFRDVRGDNNIGLSSGDLLNYGGYFGSTQDPVGALPTNQIRSDGGSVGATYPASGFTDPPIACSPFLGFVSGFCANATAFNLNRVAVPWQFTFTKPGEAPLTVTGPALVGPSLPTNVTYKVPPPTNVTISAGATPTTPTISWTLPALPGGLTPDNFRFQIYDREQIRIGGAANPIFVRTLDPSATSFTIPATVPLGGLSVPLLKVGGDYVINFQVVETRGHEVPLSTQFNTQIISRSNSFFNFTPLSAGAPLNVFLPTVSADSVFHFNIGSVGPNSVTFIDPVLAVGYDYRIGAGDPNFASVLLPTGIGDNLFDLFLVDTGIGDYVDSGIDLVGGTQFFFGAGGVDRFRIRGIETTAGLDPANATAFITGLTFATDGQFSGTMTPLTVFISGVPLPGTIALVGLGLALLGFNRRLDAERPR